LKVIFHKIKLGRITMPFMFGFHLSMIIVPKPAHHIK
jgi:hypothetical protein